MYKAHRNTASKLNYKAAPPSFGYRTDEGGRMAGRRKLPSSSLSLSPLDSLLFSHHHHYPSLVFCVPIYLETPSLRHRRYTGTLKRPFPTLREDKRERSVDIKRHKPHDPTFLPWMLPCLSLLPPQRDHHIPPRYLGRCLDRW